MSLIIVDEQFTPIAKGIIETAKSSIDISSFKIELSHTKKTDKITSLFNLLAEKAKEGVKVRVLINWHDDRHSVPMTNEYAMKFCKNNNIKVRHLKNNRCCHAKLIIIDEEKAIIGSHNLSRRSVTANFEVSALLSNIENVRPLRAIYERVWQDAKKA